MLYHLCLQMENIELPTDPKTNKRRGFVFITFKEESAVKKIVEKKYHNVSGSKVTNGEEDLVCIFLFSHTFAIDAWLWWVNEVDLWVCTVA